MGGAPHKETSRIGIVAGGAWAWHAADIVARGEAWDLLWMCNLGGLVLAVGLLARSRVAVAVAAAWLALGVPLWALDLLGGGELRASSVVSHLGGSALAALGVWRLGWPAGSWRIASVALAALVGASRLATPPSANVNLAFAVWPGWEGWFGGHVVYLAFLGGLAASVFAAVERMSRRVTGRCRASGGV